MKIFIMGMHRSGTSLVTGLLNKCGLYLGNNLLMGAKDNPKGHFEDRRFIGINNELLIFNGGSWRKPPGEIIWLKKHENKARALLDSFPKEKICGFKDPRICLTFPFWYQMTAPEEVKVVFVKRPTSEIAQSLKKRNGMPLSIGKNLANIYNWRAAVNIQKTEVSYSETYFHDYFRIGWKVKLCYLCSVLGLEFPKDLGPLEKFIDERLWHNRQAKNE